MPDDRITPAGNLKPQAGAPGPDFDDDTGESASDDDLLRRIRRGAMSDTAVKLYLILGLFYVGITKEVEVSHLERQVSELVKATNDQTSLIRELSNSHNNTTRFTEKIAEQIVENAKNSGQQKQTIDALNGRMEAVNGQVLKNRKHIADIRKGDR